MWSEIDIDCFLYYCVEVSQNTEARIINNSMENNRDKSETESPVQIEQRKLIQF